MNERETFMFVLGLIVANQLWIVVIIIFVAPKIAALKAAAGIKAP